MLMSWMSCNIYSYKVIKQLKRGIFKRRLSISSNSENDNLLAS